MAGWLILLTCLQPWEGRVGRREGKEETWKSELLEGRDG